MQIAAADVNVMPVNVSNKLILDYSLSKLGSVQANLRMYKSTKMTVIELQSTNSNIQYYRSGR